jgi:DNA replication protein DnaC
MAVVPILWCYAVFGVGDPTLADPILDRIIHNAHRLQLKGDSLRKQMAAQSVDA